ncbi:MAG TPA: 5-oxoprolinase subunit PxpA [Capsulimonadaceae bacterium]|jgi:UPF0271 protein
MSVRSIDLNADLGEGMPGEEQILRLVSSANIACGYHAGDHATMDASVREALRFGVAIGAHPGLDDKVGFGRHEMSLTPQEAAALVTTQIADISALCARHGGFLHHVKPHGALYWMLEKDGAMADAVLRAIDAYDHKLVVYCLSGGNVARRAHDVGIHVALEIFADRAYMPTGALVPRSRPGAVIDDPDAAVSRITAWGKTGSIEAQGGALVSLAADTICVHGDEPHAFETARKLRDALLKDGWRIEAPPGKASE